jgi:ribose/xylose/arabinose/galactoside ABC-type transport system permease subunit
MMILIRGVALTISNSKPIIVTDHTTIALSNMTVGPIPVITIIFLIIVLLLEFVLRFTVFGRNIYAVGGNAEIAGSIGINVKFYKFIVFIIFAILAGIGGLFLMTRMNAGSPIIGEDAPLATIPMAVMGGTALSGGKGGALKTLTGVILLSLLFNSMSILGITLNIQTFVKGAILLSIIVWNKYLANRTKKV